MTYLTLDQSGETASLTSEEYPSDLFRASVLDCNTLTAYATVRLQGAEIAAAACVSDPNAWCESARIAEFVDDDFIHCFVILSRY